MKNLTIGEARLLLSKLRETAETAKPDPMNQLPDIVAAIDARMERQLARINERLFKLDEISDIGDD